MTCGIYIIVNLLNNKFYLGSSENIEKRWIQHQNLLNNNKHGNKFLQNTWNKNNSENFELRIIEICENTNRIERENIWLNYTKCYNSEIGYNICFIAGSVLGIKRSDESKAKMSIWQKGKPKWSDDEKLNISFHHPQRNKEKWPCFDGWKCKCNNCKQKQKEESKIKMRKYRQSINTIDNPDK
jgi:group I intron endonuclease